MKRKTRIVESLKAIGIAVVFSCGVSFLALAAERNSEESAEIVFLLDASASMKTQDREWLALDAIRQGIYSVPSNCQTGFVAYGTEVQTVVPLTEDKEKLDMQIDGVEYGGYTNAGAGLTQAVGLFSDTPDKTRYIIMLSDGEIDMPGAEEEKKSRESYKQAAAYAEKKGIQICIIAIGSELNNPQMHIFDGAEITDGTIYWEGSSGSLTQIIERIVSHKLQIPRQPLAATDAEEGKILAELPAGVNQAKIMITSDNEIEQVTAQYDAEGGHITTGKRFAAVDLERPEPGTVEICFLASEVSEVQAYLVTEFVVKPQVLVEYRIEPAMQAESKEQEQPSYEHFADLTIEVIDTGKGHTNIFTGKAFEGLEVPYSINSVPFTGVVEQGRISHTIPADGIDEVEVVVELSSSGAICHIEQPVVSPIPKIPDPEFVPDPDYRPLWGILGGLAAIITVLGIWLLKKNQTTILYVSQPSDIRNRTEKTKSKPCTYTGKFNMYVVKTADGTDVPPQTYRLFGRRAGKLSLNQVLQTCKIRLGKSGAENIIFYPGPDHSVIITDQSERCTVMRGMEILKKGMGYPVFYGEKITVSFEDEVTEIEAGNNCRRWGEGRCQLYDGAV